ncbi:Lipid A export ATP-binding/permease protein MsbA [Altererythrobacter insulae]|nr:Lipid A export ATP-binding/permease protein MsbA [Altererythrobacter insulae]
MLNGAMADANDISDIQALRELKQHVDRGDLIQLAVLSLMVSLSEGVGLFLIIPIADFVLTNTSSGLAKFAAPLIEFGVAPLLLAVTVLVILRALLVYRASEMRRGIQLQLSNHFRTSMHEAIATAEWRWLAQQRSSDHAALTMGEAERSASLFNDVITIMSACATFLVLSVVAAIAFPALLVVALILAIVPIILAAFLRGRKAREGHAYWGAYTRMQEMLSDGVARVRGARLLGGQKALLKEFTQQSSELANLEKRYFRRGHLIQTAIQIAAVTMLAALIYAASHMEQIAGAATVAAIVFAIRSIPLFNQAHQGWRSWHYNRPALARIVQYERTGAQHREQHTEAGTVSFERSIELRRVGLTYEGRNTPVLSQFSLAIKKGQFVAVTGRSGIGKSSLADLMSGLILADEGELLIDGVSLTLSNRTAWREKIGYLEQKPFFFAGTLRDNLSWGRGKTSDDDLLSAIGQASASFVLDWPDQLETIVGEAGRQLSGGEARRIALARTLLRQPDFLILDEVTASLDVINSKAILSALSLLKGTVTVLALTHDPRVTKVADLVCDMDAGV